MGIRSWFSEKIVKPITEPRDEAWWTIYSDDGWTEIENEIGEKIAKDLTWKSSGGCMINAHGPDGQWTTDTTYWSAGPKRAPVLKRIERYEWTREGGFRKDKVSHFLHSTYDSEYTHRIKGMG